MMNDEQLRHAGAHLDRKFVTRGFRCGYIGIPMGIVVYVLGLSLQMSVPALTSILVFLGMLIVAVSIIGLFLAFVFAGIEQAIVNARARTSL